MYALRTVLRQAASSRTLRRSCDSAAVTAESRVDQRLLEREDVPLLEARKAAGEWRTGSQIPIPPFLMEGLSLEPSVFDNGNLGGFPEAVFERSLQPLSIKVEAGWRHRAGMTAGLAPTEAETKKN